MKKLLLLFTILISQLSFAGAVEDKCLVLQKEYKFASLQLKLSYHEVEKYEELYHDVSFNNDVAKAVAAASIVTLGGGAATGLAALGAGALAGGDAMLVLFAAFQTYMIGSYSLGQLLGISIEEYNNEERMQKLFEAFSEIRGVLKIYRDQLKVLETERHKINLDWDRAWDSLTLGLTGKRTTQKLYEIAKLKNIITKAKVIFLEETMAAGTCPLR